LYRPGVAPSGAALTGGAAFAAGATLTGAAFAASATGTFVVGSASTARARGQVRSVVVVDLRAHDRMAVLRHELHAPAQRAEGVERSGDHGAEAQRFPLPRAQRTDTEHFPAYDEGLRMADRLALQNLVVVQALVLTQVETHVDLDAAVGADSPRGDLVDPD